MAGHVVVFCVWPDMSPFGASFLSFYPLLATFSPYPQLSCEPGDELIATDIVNNLPKEVQKGLNKKAEINKMKKKEIVAIIAYLQRLGTDIKVKAKK